MEQVAPGSIDAAAAKESRCGVLPQCCVYVQNSSKLHNLLSTHQSWLVVICKMFPGVSRCFQVFPGVSRCLLGFWVFADGYLNVLDILSWDYLRHKLTPPRVNLVRTWASCATWWKLSSLPWKRFATWCTTWPRNLANFCCVEDSTIPQGFHLCGLWFQYLSIVISCDF